VLDGELNARMRWVNLPRACRNEGCCACRSHDPPPSEKRNREPCTTCPANEHPAKLTGHCTLASECGQRSDPVIACYRLCGLNVSVVQQDPASRTWRCGNRCKRIGGLFASRLHRKAATECWRTLARTALSALDQPSRPRNRGVTSDQKIVVVDGSPTRERRPGPLDRLAQLALS
jgi:hypothetical protein